MHRFKRKLKWKSRKISESYTGSDGYLHGLQLSICDAILHGDANVNVGIVKRVLNIESYLDASSKGVISSKFAISYIILLSNLEQQRITPRIYLLNGRR